MKTPNLLSMIAVGVFLGLGSLNAQSIINNTSCALEIDFHCANTDYNCTSACNSLICIPPNSTSGFPAKCSPTCGYWAWADVHPATMSLDYISCTPCSGTFFVVYSDPNCGNTSVPSTPTGGTCACPNISASWSGGNLTFN